MAVSCCTGGFPATEPLPLVDTVALVDVLTPARAAPAGGQAQPGGGLSGRSAVAFPESVTLFRVVSDAETLKLIGWIFTSIPIRSRAPAPMPCPVVPLELSRPVTSTRKRLQ